MYTYYHKSLWVNFCHGEKYFIPHGVAALRVDILQLDSYQVVEVKKSFACSTDLENAHRSCERFVLLPRIECPVAPFALPCGIAS